MEQITEEKSEYDKQAEEFLKKTGTEFKVTFLRNGLYFGDDKEERDIYKITLKRGEREFKFTFGQSLNDSGLRLYSQNGKRTGHKGFSIPKEIREIIDKRKQAQKLKYWFEKKYFSLSGLIYDFGKEPSAYDVLAGLQKYEVASFQDFCDDFGYNDDSIKAKTIYEAVCKEYDSLKMLYNEAELNLLREIQ